jgi:hypothetical protein
MRIDKKYTEMEQLDRMHVFVPNLSKKAPSECSEEASASNRQESQYGDEDDCSFIANSEMEDIADEDSGEARSESHKEPSEHNEGFDYICPPTVKWLLYPDDDDEEEQSPSSKS